MMNKKQSSLLHVARYAVLVPLVAAPILFIACSDEEAEITPPGGTSTTATEQASTQPNTLDAAAIYYIDGEETTNEAVEKLAPEAIHSVNVVKGESATEVFGDRAANGVIAVTTKKNQNSPEVLEFNEKLSAISPPPPVITEEEVVIPDIEIYTHDASTAPEDYKAFLKRNSEVRQISWESNEQQDGIKSVVVHLKSGGSEVYDFNDKQSIATAERKYGQLPALPPPPPPVKHDTPLFPAGTTAKLIEDEKAVAYILRPGDITEKELRVAENAFKKSGFNLSLDGQFEGDKLINLKISLSSPETGDKANAVYTAASLQSLKEANNVAVIKADKRTGELIIGNTIAPE